MTNSDAVRQHYQAAITDPGALLAQLGQLLDTLGSPLSAARLAPLDQFHMGGLAATAALARRVSIQPGTRVLDAGSGLGGPSRYLAETFGCHVDGVDLSPDYVAVATLLTDRAGLADRITYRAGDLLALPYPDGHFDVVWSQHVVMNIRDRAGLYRELRRVLRPGGTYAFYDPLAAPGADAPQYPLPWAATPETSTLLTADETRTALAAAGFQVVTFDDVTAEAVGWAGEAAAQPSALSAALVVGARMGGLAQNFMHSLREGRVRLAMGVCRAS